MISNSENPTMYVGGKPKGNYTNMFTIYISEKTGNKILDERKELTYKIKRDKHILIYEMEK
ncbi:MAG TPA: hypothetical protein DC034_01100 [Clostridium sp.]|jgi:hypothetical protein|uniref:Uncharacterized protein n=2 Tax=Clostridium TaxID=1485 RepID=A0ABV4E052_9CLOT|nr:hypothetical protein [Clostridiales bacterium]HBC95375.1 hypothetical protein [Clostridium sp.]